MDSWVFLSGDRVVRALWVLEIERAKLMNPPEPYPPEWPWDKPLDSGWPEWYLPANHALTTCVRAGYVRRRDWPRLMAAAFDAAVRAFQIWLQDKYPEADCGIFVPVAELAALGGAEGMTHEITRYSTCVLYEPGNWAWLDGLRSLTERDFRYILTRLGVIGSLCYTALTVGQSASLLGVTPRQVRRMIRQGALRAELVNINGREAYAISALSLSANALNRGIGS